MRWDLVPQLTRSLPSWPPWDRFSGPAPPHGPVSPRPAGRHTQGPLEAGPGPHPEVTTVVSLVSGQPEATSPAPSS